MIPVRHTLLPIPSVIDSWYVFSGVITDTESYSTPLTNIDNPNPTDAGFFAVPNFEVILSGNATYKTEIEFFDKDKVSISKTEIQSANTGGIDPDKAYLEAYPMNLIQNNTGKTIHFTRYHITCNTEYTWTPAHNQVLKLGLITKNA